jgi:hypothetical protein
MKKEIADLWVKALRSGEYRQCQGALIHRDEGSFCCLGVLCDIHARTTGQGSWDPERIQGYFTYSGDRQTGVDSGSLPYDVSVWASTNSSDPEVSLVPIPEQTSDFTTLAGLNDDHGYTFNQIADVIEANWENL